MKGSRSFLAGITVAGLAMLASGCVQEEPEATATVPPSATRPLTPPPGTLATPTPTLTPGPTQPSGEIPFTEVPNPTSLPAPAAIPANWETYVQPPAKFTEGFTFRYPPSWFLSGTPGADAAALDNWSWVLTSWDATTPRGQPLPLDSIKLDIGTFVASATYTCQITGANSATVRVGNIDLLATVKRPVDQSASDVDVIYNFEGDHGGYHYCLSAAITKLSPGNPRLEMLLSQILSTFVFGQ